MNNRLNEKNVLLGVTGSIAAYKACLVLRLLQSAGAKVRVMMTETAQKFIGKWTFEALTQQEVMTDLFPDNRIMSTEHVHIAEWADALLICPATANCIGKVASGIADDFLTTTIMASRAPVIFAPAMDLQMFENPIFKSNCDRLRSLNYHILQTDSGVLASGLHGYGRLAEPGCIVDSVRKVLSESTKIQGKKILISAGPTREYIDAVRYISNPSSGKMGIALAEEAYLRGADVTIVCGPIQEPVMNGISVHHVESAQEMADAITKYWSDHDLLIMAAAVADYSPKEVHSGKMKKGDQHLSIELKRTQDILENAAKTKGKRLVIGFALESDSAMHHAIQKLHDKNLDLICLNIIDLKHNAFGSDTNIITLIDKNETAQELPEMPKHEASKHIWDKIESIMES
ncbi:bifunctional phosphopantothenoylcysteine decarboxylase/phosphopantothenate--cysteine ligase CoaBC [bacterium]